MFGISFEHLLVLGIILLFVGPRRLPELGHTLGKAIKNFKDSVSGIEEARFRKIDEVTPGKFSDSMKPGFNDGKVAENEEPEKEPKS